MMEDRCDDCPAHHICTARTPQPLGGGWNPHGKPGLDHCPGLKYSEKRDLDEYYEHLRFKANEFERL